MPNTQGAKGGHVRRVDAAVALGLRHVCRSFGILPTRWHSSPCRYHSPFDHPEWVFELKYDGFRSLAVIQNGDTEQGMGTRTNGIQVIQWLGWADEDYLAARALLLRGFVLQGTMLANTSIEKYIKAALLARGVPFRNTHDVTALYESLKSSGTVAPVSASFLKALGKAYRLRYPDDLAAGFNIALAQVKILAEMDAVVHALRERFAFHATDGHSVTTKLDAMLAGKDTTLTERNAAFGSCMRAEVFAITTHCYELRVLDDGSILEATYEAGPIPDDGVFDAEGIKPANVAITT